MSRARRAAATGLVILSAGVLGATAGVLGNPGRPHEPSAQSVRELGRCLETLPHCWVEYHADGTQEVLGRR